MAGEETDPMKAGNGEAQEDGVVVSKSDGAAVISPDRSYVTEAPDGTLTFHYPKKGVDYISPPRSGPAYARPR